MERVVRFLHIGVHGLLPTRAMPALTVSAGGITGRGDAGTFGSFGTMETSR